MQFFLHYVGQAGAASDFPKTVFTQRPTSLVLDQVEDSHPSKGSLLMRLGEHFPSGRWNCWGVPSGAEAAIQLLSEGDIVLLMETSANEGAIPALCEVKVYVGQEFPSLSRALWGDHGYPYIFFFDTQPLSLTWPELRTKLGYNENYQGPIGQIQRFGAGAMQNAGGSGQLLAWLESKRTSAAPTRFSLGPPLNVVREAAASFDVHKGHDDVITASIQTTPTLTDDAELMPTTTYAYPRTEAFRRDIRRLYNERCAVCSLGIESPDGYPEVQSAHIFPRYLKGRNDLRNGICLCRMHHWALDAGWMGFSDSRKVIVRGDLPSHHDYDFIRSFKDKRINEPTATAFLPHPLFLSAHRRLHKFEPGDIQS